MTGDRQLTGAGRHEFSKGREGEAWCLGPSGDHRMRRLKAPRGGGRNGTKETKHRRAAVEVYIHEKLAKTTALKSP